MYTIKERPEDFLVEEIPHFVYQESGTYTILKLKKTNYTTEDVISMLAKLLHKPLRSFSYAGAKDKKAITTQCISIKNCTATRIEQIKTKLPQNVTVELTGFLDRPISTGMLTGNKFTIVVRNVPTKFTLKEPTSMINYYDEQRFSTDNVKVGLLLLKKQFLEAAKQLRWQDVREYLAISPTDGVGALQRLPRKLLTMYVHAVQSKLWNEVVSDYLDEHYKCKNVSYAEGTLAIPTETVPNKNIPLFGVGVTIPNYVEAEYTNIVSKYGLTREDFIIKQLPDATSTGADRNLVVPIKDFKAEQANDDKHIGMHKYTLSFTLPKGSYATMLIKQLFL